MFIQKLEKAQKENDSLVCVGLDPNIAKIQQLGLTLSEWLKKIVDSTATLVCAFKPQIAYFSALRAERELAEVIQYIHQQYPKIPVILDAKRGDIGDTAEQYAIEAFERYRADAITVNPYMGGDTLEPYLKHRNKGVIALCKTSNLGSSELQDIKLGNGLTLFEYVAQLATKKWNTNKNLMLVVGATYPQELADVRQMVGQMPLLIPGIGAQGGDLKATLKAGLRADGLGLIISSSRGILYAGEHVTDFEQAARQACLKLKTEINVFRETNQ